jgi:hypothetical protein
MRFLFIVAALILSACSPSPASSSASPSQGTGGSPVTLSGTGSTKTAPMSWSGAYRVDYSFVGDLGLLADLDDPATGLPVTLVLNVVPGAPKQGTTHVFGLSGSLYLNVVANGVWTITFTPSG